MTVVFIRPLVIRFIHPVFSVVKILSGTRKDPGFDRWIIWLKSNDKFKFMLGLVTGNKRNY